MEAKPLEQEWIMHCREIMSREVQWIAPEASVAHAADLMAFHNLGFLPVCDGDGRPIGVITDRDIALRVVGQNRPAAETRVEDVMTAPLHSVGLDCRIADAGELMVEEGIARLLVIDNAGVLEGVVSLTDLMMHGPGHTALRTARGIYAREARNRSDGHPHPASEPTPEFFHGARDFTFYQEGLLSENPARVEAEVVNTNSENLLKEFPS
jgi:CBS domain-containing protein